MTSDGAQRKAIVIGAGPMGLTTAWLLQQRGWQVSVFEADSRIGGMSAHFDFDGMNVERFYHFVCRGDEPLLQLLAELDLLSIVRWEITRMGFYYAGELFEWGRPDALWSFPHLGLWEKLRYAVHVLRARAMRDWRSLDGVEATAWLRRWLGERVYDMLWKKSFELKFYEHSGSISAAWLATRIRRVSLSRKNAFNEQMGYLVGGSEILLQTLQRRIEDGGGTVTLRSPIERVLSENGRVTGVRTGGQTHEAERVVSTVPLQFVPGMVPQLSGSELGQIAALENIGVVCVKFKLSERFTPYFWINVNDDRIEVPGIIEYTNLNPLSSHLVYVPYYLPHGHPKWAWDSAAFETEALAILRLMRPDWEPEAIEAIHTSRYRYAQPICRTGFVNALPPMRTSIEGFLMADTAYCYPEDRSISESVRISQQLVDAAGSP